MRPWKNAAAILAIPGMLYILAVADITGFGLSASAQSVTEDLEATADAVQEDFTLMLDSLEKTNKKLDKFLENIELADEAFLQLIYKNRDNPQRVKQLKEALRLVRTVQTEVYDQVGNLKLLQKGAGHVKSAFDLYDKIKEVRDRAAKRKGGPLGKNLSVLADVMKEYGGNVPLIGDAIEMYGDITGQLLDATDKLAGTIDQSFKQNMIGVGVSQNIDDPRYLRLKEQFPQNSHITLAPEGPGFLFKNINTNDQKSYIWDEDADTWHVVEGPVPATRVFARLLSTGQRLTPVQLAFLVSHGSAAVKREENARTVYAIMKRMRDSINMDIEFEANRLYGYDIMRDQRIPELFYARYIYDGQYRDLVRRYAAQIWMDAQTLGGSARFARALEDWADASGFDLYDTLTEEQKQDLAARLEALRKQQEAADQREQEHKQRKKLARIKPEDPEEQMEPEAPRRIAENPSPEPPPSPPPAKVRPAPEAPKKPAIPGAPSSDPDLPATAAIAPWDKALPKSVCLSFQALNKQTFDGANYQNLVPAGDPAINEKDGTCSLRYSGEMRDVNGNWQTLGGFELTFNIDEIRNRLSQLSGENTYDRVCTKWKTAEWCAGQTRVCTEETSRTYCIRWQGAISSPECAEEKTDTVCSKWEWICAEAKAKVYCDKWGPASDAPRQARAPIAETPPPAQNESGPEETVNGVSDAIDCQEILKKYPANSLDPEAMRARLKCIGINGN